MYTAILHVHLGYLIVLTELPGNLWRSMEAVFLQTGRPSNTKQHRQSIEVILCGNDSFLMWNCCKHFLNFQWILR